MNKVSVLEEGVRELEKLREQLLALDAYKKELSEFDVLEQSLEQEIQKKDAEIASEIEAVIADREQEIEKSYDEQMARQKSKKKKAEEDKLKKKDKKVKERVAIETAELREENESLLDESKFIFRQNKVSSIYNTRFYYAMFFPHGIGDIIIDLLVAFFIFFAIPKGIVFAAAPKNALLFEVLTYIITILIAAALYYAVYYRTKLRAPDAVEKGKELHHKIRKNTRKIKKIKRKIVKDKDESLYELDSYDKEIEKLDKKIREIELEKGVAVATLKNTTGHVLANEVRSKHEVEKKALLEQYDAQKEKIHHTEERIRESSSKITNHYQAYLGAEFMTVEAIEALIAIMKEQDLHTVSEAVQIYRKKSVS